jgi:hypothetical protein
MLPVGIPIERDERSDVATDKYLEVKCVPLFCAVDKVENARPAPKSGVGEYWRGKETKTI